MYKKEKEKIRPVLRVIILHGKISGFNFLYNRMHFLNCQIVLRIFINRKVLFKRLRKISFLIIHDLSKIISNFLEGKFPTCT